MLLALCLVLGCGLGCLAEEAAEKTYSELHPEVLAFDSYWVSGDAAVRIDARHTEGGYEMNIVEMTGENTFNSWEYLLVYDEEKKALVANGTGMKYANTFGDGGEIIESQKEYEDGNASFYINDQGELAWSDEKESTFEATLFHRIGYFPGTYLHDRATLRINWAGEDLIYDVNLDWTDSASQSWTWALSGNYDPEAGNLPLSGFKLLYTYKDDGELDLDADQHEAEVNAVFALDDNMQLVVVSSDDDTLAGLAFERDATFDYMWLWQF